MTNSWDERKKAQEEDFFRKQNEAAIARMKQRTDTDKPRLSPVTGEPMEQVTMMGVAVDRCKKSGGIWLDAGELEQIIKAARESDDSDTWFSKFFGGLSSK